MESLIFKFQDKDGADCVLVQIKTSDDQDARPVKYVKVLYSGYRRAMELKAGPPWYLNMGSVRVACTEATGKLVGLGRVLVAAHGGEKIVLIDKRIGSVDSNGEVFDGVINYRDDNLRIVKGHAKRRDLDPVKKARGEG